MKQTRFCLVLLLSLCLVFLSGCHGSRDQAAFSVPDQLEESQQQEITFWATAVSTPRWVSIRPVSE